MGLTAFSLGVGELNSSKSVSPLGGRLPDSNLAPESYLVTNRSVSPILYFGGGW